MPERNIQKYQRYKNTKINSNEQRYEVSETNLNERRGTVTKSGDRKVTNCLVSKIFIDEKSSQVENIANDVDAIPKSVNITNMFLESRTIGVMAVTVTVSCLFITLFIILNNFFSSVLIVQILVASLLFGGICTILILQYFIELSTEIMINFVRSYCDVLQKMVQLFLYSDSNGECNLSEESRSRYAKFVTDQL